MVWSIIGEINSKTILDSMTSLENEWTEVLFGETLEKDKNKMKILIVLAGITIILPFFSLL